MEGLRKRTLESLFNLERYGENMTIDVPETDHHIVISADSHCGADLRDYKPYLEKKYHSDFEEWANASEEAAKKQEALFSGKGQIYSRNVGIDGDPDLDADRNFFF